MMTSFDDAPTSSPRLEALTKVAFVLLLTLPVVRVTMLEILRDPFDISPGSAPVPRGPGATTTVLLNMLCMLPMLLTLARAALDRAWRLRFNWSHLPLALLAGWTVLSAAWAHDRFAALVTGTTFLSAAAMLWAAGQLVRSWGNFRLVTSVGVGLLGVFLAYGVAYRTVEFPDLQRSWQLNKQQILRERGWDEDSFSARQFAKRVESGELAGFSASPNTFGAVLVLALGVSVALGVQRARDDGRAWWLFVIGAGAVGAWLLVHTGSRTAMLTPFIALGIVLFAWLWKRLFPSRARGAFWVGVLLFLLGAGALIGHGLYHGTLFHDSLTFRWKYWVGSMRVFEQHPWLGVGSYNFGLHYLRVRLPEASEEIKDPHNFIVRTFVELGAIGGVLLMVWMLRLWRELTLPGAPAPDDDIPDKTIFATRNPSTQWGKVIPWVAGVATLAMGVNAVLSIDWSQELAFVLTELLKRILYGLALVVGMSAVVIRSMQNPELDTRASGVVLAGTLASVGVFLVHNLVDFSLFEAGPMMVFALLVGAALGVRSSATYNVTTEPSGRSRAAAAVGLGVVGLAWIVGWFVWVAPVVSAESAAATGDEALRASQFDEAVDAYDRASAHLPINSDYAFRAARALTFARAPVDPILDRLDRARRANPSSIETYTFAAQLRASVGDIRAAKIDFDQALELNPNDVGLRLTYADVLSGAGERTLAREQYERALKFDDLLDVNEPKRLGPEKRRVIQSRIDTL